MPEIKKVFKINQKILIPNHLLNYQPRIVSDFHGLIGYLGNPFTLAKHASSFVMTVIPSILHSNETIQSWMEIIRTLQSQHSRSNCLSEKEEFYFEDLINYLLDYLMPMGNFENCDKFELSNTISERLIKNYNNLPKIENIEDQIDYSLLNEFYSTIKIAKKGIGGKKLLFMINFNNLYFLFSDLLIDSMYKILNNGFINCDIDLSPTINYLTIKFFQHKEPTFYNYYSKFKDLSETLTLGADPEFLIYEKHKKDPHYGKMIAAHSFFQSGERALRAEVGTDGCSHILELRPKYSKSPTVITKNIQNCISKTKTILDKSDEYFLETGGGCRLSLGGHIHFGSEIWRALQHKDLKIFLTMLDDFLYYPIKENMRGSAREWIKDRVNLDRNETFSIGSSIDLRNHVTSKKFQKGVAFTCYDTPSSYRFQDWGLEYRSLPSFLADESFTKIVFKIAKAIALRFFKMIKDNEIFTYNNIPTKEDYAMLISPKDVDIFFDYVGGQKSDAFIKNVLESWENTNKIKEYMLTLQYEFNMMDGTFPSNKKDRLKEIFEKLHCLEYFFCKNNNKKLDEFINQSSRFLKKKILMQKISGIHIIFNIYHMQSIYNEMGITLPNIMIFNQSCEISPFLSLKLKDGQYTLQDQNDVFRNFIILNEACLTKDILDLNTNHDILSKALGSLVVDIANKKEIKNSTKNMIGLETIMRFNNKINDYLLTEILDEIEFFTSIYPTYYKATESIRKRLTNLQELGKVWKTNRKMTGQCTFFPEADVVPDVANEPMPMEPMQDGGDQRDMIQRLRNIQNQEGIVQRLRDRQMLEGQTSHSVMPPLGPISWTTVNNTIRCTSIPTPANDDIICGNNDEDIF